MKRTIVKISVGAACALVAALIWQQVDAYTVATGGSEPCHERFSGRAYQEVILELPTVDLEFPSNDTWRELVDYMLGNMEIDPDSVDEDKKYLLLSLVAGTRVNDTDGHTLFNLESLRKVHADPSAEGQYTHALRGPDDDYDEGNAIAVEGTRQAITDLVQAGQGSLIQPAKYQNIETSIYMDFYGDIDLVVWGPAFYLGSAAHIVQDSFAHTIRTEQSEFKKIAHVMNYIDAISSEHDELRDGLAHSDTYDKCQLESLRPVVEAADAATTAFFAAVNEQISGRDEDAVEAFLDEWLTLEEGCTFENDLCDNGQWLELAREEQTKPYMEAIFGCSCAVIGSPAHGQGGFLFLLLGLGILVSLWRLRQKE